MRGTVNTHHRGSIPLNALFLKDWIDKIDLILVFTGLGMPLPSSAKQLRLTLSILALWQGHMALRQKKRNPASLPYGLMALCH